MPGRINAAVTKAGRRPLEPGGLPSRPAAGIPPDPESAAEARSDPPSPQSHRSSPTARGDSYPASVARFFWAIFEPGWMKDLDLDASTRYRVRERAHTLRLNDGLSIQPRSYDADARATRMRLAGRFLLNLTGALVGLPPIVMMLAAPQLTAGGGWARVAGLIVLEILAQIWFLLIAHRWAMPRALTPYYATALREQGVSVCLKCGYHRANGDRTKVCPECGLMDPLSPPP